MRVLTKCLMLILLIPSLALAQALPMRNDTDATLRDLGADRNVGKNFNVDSAGRQKLIISSGTAGVNNPVIKEDVATLDGGSGFAAFLKFLDTNPFDAAVSSTGDAQFMLADAEGRFAVNAYGANVAEFFSSCSSAITGTSRTAIKAGVASNRIYVTSITCSNNSAVTSQMSFTDGAGAQLAAGNVTALGGTGFDATFPVPLRGTVNTDFSVTLTTTATSTICCANGYIANN